MPIFQDMYQKYANISSTQMMFLTSEEDFLSPKIIYLMSHAYVPKFWQKDFQSQFKFFLICMQWKVLKWGQSIFDPYSPSPTKKSRFYKNSHIFYIIPFLKKNQKNYYKKSWTLLTYRGLWISAGEKKVTNLRNDWNKIHKKFLRYLRIEMTITSSRYLTATLGSI